MIPRCREPSDAVFIKTKDSSVLTLWHCSGRDIVLLSCWSFSVLQIVDRCLSPGMLSVIVFLSSEKSQTISRCFTMPREKGVISLHLCFSQLIYDNNLDF